MLTFKDCVEIDGLIIKNISNEEWREYEHGGSIFRISNPVALYIRTGGTTHRIIDDNGISHCHPIPGRGCALRWKGDPPVSF